MPRSSSKITNSARSDGRLGPERASLRSSSPSSISSRRRTGIGLSGLGFGRAAGPLSFARISTLAAWPVSPSMFARKTTSSAISLSPLRVNRRMLVRLRKSFAFSPLENRAVPPVGSTCDGPAA